MCTCGQPSPHIIATRTAADGLVVHMWDDGGLSGVMGVRLPGVPIRRPRSESARHQARVAGRLFCGEVCLYDRADFGALYEAAQYAARRDGLPGTLRARLRERREAPPRLHWTVTHTDRDGRPTERVCRLPALHWPGMAVWDYCCGPGSAQGRYVVHTRVRGTTDTYEPAGFAFRRLRALWDYLRATTLPVTVSA